MPKRFRIGLSLVFFLAGWLAAGFTQPSIAIADTMSLTTLHANIDGNWISGEHFPSNTEMAVSIYGSGDNYKADFDVYTDNEGDFFAKGWQYWPDQLIARGDVIEVVYDDQSVTQTVTMTVQNLNAKVDPDNNRVTGTAFTPDGDPLVGRRINMIVYEGWWGPGRDILHVYREIYVDGDGNFEIGGDPDEFKIERGYGLHLHLHDIPDDIKYITSIHPYNGIPRLQVAQDHNWIKGYGFPYTVNVELSINAETDLTTLINSDSWGIFQVKVGEFADHQLLPGDTIRAEYYDEYYDRDEFVFVTLPHIDASVDTQTGTISGTAPGFAGQSISVEIYSFFFEKRLHETTGQVNQAGEFQVEWDGLEPGQEIRLVLTDSAYNEFLYHPDNSPQIFAGGEGTPNDPYLIETPEQLDMVRNLPDKHFRQNANIDLSNWATGPGWKPICEYMHNAFNGSYDGNGYIIENLRINRPEESEVGLFGAVGSSGKLINITLEGVDVTGYDGIGALAGANKGIISQCHVIDGTVTGITDGFHVGGLVGENISEGWIEHCHSGADVSGDFIVGGLVGNNIEHSTIINSSSSGTVTGVNAVGGLAGKNLINSTIMASFATGDVTGIDVTGGLAGENLDESVIKESYATGSVSGEFITGGLVGLNYVDSTIESCFASGPVTGDTESDLGGDYTGGLVGVNGLIWKDIEGPGLVKNAYSVGPVSGGNYVGGLIGSQGIEIDGENENPLDHGEVEKSFWNTDGNPTEMEGVGFGDNTGVFGESMPNMKKQTTFEDNEWDFNNIWAIDEGENYPFLQWMALSEATCTISGSVTLDGAGLENVRILVSEGTDTTTDGSGNYTVTVDHGWSGTVTPEKAGHAFVPESIDFEEIDGDQEGRDFSATHIADNQPPDKPILIQPIGNAVVMTGEVTLEAGPYSDPEDDPHIRTRWQVIESGSGEMVYEYQSEYDATVHVVPALTPGIKYEWRVGYQDSGSDRFSWSDMETFIVGIQEEDQNVPPVQAGYALADYRMLSVVHWPVRPAAVDAFGPMLTGEYDFGDYRIGTYDANKDGLGGYREYPDFEVRPGKAYWVLAREGMAPSVTGVPVTLDNTVDIPLAYNSETLDGWNMIGVPNDARYQWGDIHVMVRNAGGEVVFGPAPIRDLAAGNGYLDKRVWVWEDGRYRYSGAYEFTLDPYAGYWVRVREQEAGENVFLSFLPDFQVTADTRGQMQQNLLVAPDLQTEKDLPPFPMRESGDAGSGCFVKSLAGDKR